MAGSQQLKSSKFRFLCSNGSRWKMHCRTQIFRHIQKEIRAFNFKLKIKILPFFHESKY